MNADAFMAEDVIMYVLFDERQSRKAAADSDYQWMAMEDGSNVELNFLGRSI
jgi:hypothetical protein